MVETSTTRRKAGTAPAKLLSIDITGYRSCQHTIFTPHTEVSALIGMNGAGKTNILSALRLLASRARSGVDRDSFTSIKPSIITTHFNVAGKTIGLKLTVYLSDSNKGQDEIIHIEETWNFMSFTSSSEWVHFPIVAAGRDGKIRFRFDNEVMLKSSSKKSYDNFFLKLEKLLDNQQLVSAVLAVNDFRKDIKYYSATQFTDPSRCPSNFEIDEEGRLVEGVLTPRSPHAKFLHDLYSLKENDKYRYDAYCHFVAKGGLGLLSRITWREIELSAYTAEIKAGGNVNRVRKKKTLVIPKVQIGSNYISFNQLSEGTFKALAVVFNVMNDAATCLLIEEPEVCVHHGLLNGLFSTIKAYASEKQIILSTHSDLLVDKLEIENAFVVKMTSAGTECYELKTWLGQRGMDALHEYLEQTGGLGDYWRAGGLTHGH